MGTVSSSHKGPSILVCILPDIASTDHEEEARPHITPPKLTTALSSTIHIVQKSLFTYSKSGEPSTPRGLKMAQRGSYGSLAAKYNANECTEVSRAGVRHAEEPT